MAIPNDLIHFHYPFSPYARRVTWYLTLRNIDHAECIQPPTLPRPTLTTLGVSYRRIPLLSHARSLYCDTHLILPTLARLFPPTPTHPSLPSAAAAATAPLTPLLSSWSTSTPLFLHASALIPSSLPLLQDPAFQKDRQDFTGRAWTPAARAAARAEGLVYIRHAFEELEKGLLADGREWILGSSGGGPTEGDIEAVWVFHWLIVGLKGAGMEDGGVTREVFPRVWGWVGRFDGRVREAEGRMRGRGGVRRIGGGEAVEAIWGAEGGKGEAVGWDEGDPVVKAQGLRRGELVESWPVDTGSGHRDRGVLVGLSAGEAVLEVEGKGGRKVEVHHPRVGFRIRRVKEGGEGKL